MKPRKHRKTPATAHTPGLPKCANVGCDSEADAFVRAAQPDFAVEGYMCATHAEAIAAQICAQNVSIRYLRVITREALEAMGYAGRTTEQ